MKDLKAYVPVCLAVLLTAVVFLPSLGNGFTAWDDDSLLLSNPQVRSLSAGNVRNIFFSFHHGLYHPLVNLSWALEYHFAGLAPFVYHLDNLLLHLVNVVLVYALIALLGGGPWLAAGAALFFGLHPLHVESVAWVAERKDLLYTAFFLSGLIAYLCVRRTGRRWLYGTALVFYLLALGAKVMAVSFPLVLLLLDYLEGRRFDRTVWREKLPFFGLAALFGALAVLARQAPGQLTNDPAWSLNNLFIGSHRLVFHYFPRLFLPWLETPLYPGATFSQKVFAGLPLLYYAAPLLAAAFFAGLFWWARRERGIVFGLGFFLAALLPALWSIPVGPFADRFTYLASVGLFYSAGLVIRRFPPAFLAILLALVLAFAPLTWQRCAVWHDNYSLWGAAAEKYPFSREALGNRALSCVETGRGAEARVWQRRAAALK